MTVPPNPNPPQTRVIARAYAKVNLVLAVGAPLTKDAGPKAGFHPICSWMHAIDLHDDLALQRLAPGEPSRYDIAWADEPAPPRTSPIDWPIDRDLCVRAHRAIESLVGRALPLALILRKRTPVGGGLGGGSSDAAAMIEAVDALYSLGLSPEQRATISRSLGSDIEFFLRESSDLLSPPPPALVSGLGDRIERLDPPPTKPARQHAHWLVLLMPSFGCPTGPVYRAFDQSAPPPSRMTPVRERAVRELANAPTLRDDGLFNDLARPALAVQPAMGAIRQCVRVATGRDVHVTGSGSTMFLVARDEWHARQLADAALDAAHASNLDLRVLATALV